MRRTPNQDVILVLFKIQLTEGKHIAGLRIKDTLVYSIHKTPFLYARHPLLYIAITVLSIHVSKLPKHF